MRHVGDYELLEAIARGGMGVVYQARQQSLRRTVALKMLAGGHHSSEGFRKRFRQEAETVARLQHANIVPIYEVGEHEGLPYFSMEYVPGKNLAELTREQPLQPNRAAELVRTVAEAVHYAHEQGVLHRDLKPSNILLGADERPRVTDFGLARLVDAESELTRSGDTLGTPGYLPPEQASSKWGKVGRQSDVYSLGAVLYHLVTGRPPFMAGTVTETLEQVGSVAPVSPRTLNPGVPRDLETICLKCLEKEGRRRYSSAEELAVELNRFLRQEPIMARPVGDWERMWRWMRRRPVLSGWIGATAIAVLLGLVGTSWALQRARVNLLREQLANQRLRMAHVEESIQAGESLRSLENLREVIAKGPAFEAAVARALALLNSEDWLIPLASQESIGAVMPCGTWVRRATNQIIETGVARSGCHLAFWTRQDIQVPVTPSSTTTGHISIQVCEMRQKPARIASIDIGALTPTRLALSDDAAWVALADTNGCVHLARCSTGPRDVRLLGKIGGQIRSLRFSPDGATVAVGGSYGRVYLYSVQKTDEGKDDQLPSILNEHKAPVLSLAFSADGSRLLTGSADGSLRMWDTRNWQVVDELEFGTEVGDAVFGDNGGVVLVVLSNAEKAELWQIGGDGQFSTNAPLAGTPRLGQSLVSGAIHQGTDGELLISILGFKNRAWRFGLRRARTQQDLGPWPDVWWDGLQPTLEGDAILFSAGKVLLRRGLPLANGPPSAWTNQAPILSFAALTNGCVAMLDEDDRVKVLRWDDSWQSGGSWSTDLEGTQRLTPLGNGQGASLLLKGDKGLEARGLDDGRLLSSFHCPLSRFVADYATSADGEEVVVLDSEGAVSLWRPFEDRSGPLPAGDRQAATHVGISPDGKVAYLVFETQLRAYRLRDGTVLFRADASREISYLSVSPDNRRIAFAAGSVTQCLDLANRGRLRMSHSSPADVCGLAFSPDGRVLAISAWDDAIRLVDAQSGLQTSEAMPLGQAPSDNPLTQFLPAREMLLLQSGLAWPYYPPAKRAVPRVLQVIDGVLGRCSVVLDAHPFNGDQALAVLANRLFGRRHLDPHPLILSLP
ncbi:MAG: protein kinase [Verrucomicrobiales bacterium]|nr:protein kinase [Verrucomicrobiales bacterium]